MILQASEITKNFGGLQVLQGISFGLERGEILGLIGPNGAGKSTMFNVITGVYSPNSGSVTFQGADLTTLSSHRIAKRGIARTFQLVQISPTMTVFENVLVGAVFGKRKSRRKDATREALGSLEMLGLSEVRNVMAGNLTYSDRKLVEIARAIAAKPEVALLDEPLSGLNATETERMMEVIGDIRKTGISIIWIEHKMDAVFRLCDRIVVLDYGRKIAEGLPRDIAQNKTVVEAYLGESIS